MSEFFADSAVRSLNQAQASKVEDLRRLWSAERKNVTLKWQGNPYTYRGLNDSEIIALEGQGCRSNDWTGVNLLVPLNENGTAPKLAQYVSTTSFGEDVVLILPPDAEDEWTLLPDELSYLPVGCHQNLLVSRTVMDLRGRCLQNQFVQSILIEADACLIGCGSVTADRKASLDLLAIKVGPERGGRRAVVLTPHASMRDVTQQLMREDDESISDDSSTESAGLTSWNVLTAGSWIRQTPTVQSVYLHAGARIVAATAVRRCLLYPQAQICNQSAVTNARLQWKARIFDQSTLQDVMLMEGATAGPSSLCTSSVLGPDTHIASGEVHSSVLGPHTSAVHQSLVMGVLWPSGRGYVGYGAALGAHHTGRLPDQECVPGEGVIFGVSAVASFPLNLSESPYSMVGTGAHLQAQRVSMPFSLLESDSICPGWVWNKSAYSLIRLADKYVKRKRSVNHAYYCGWQIVRPSTIRLCVQARDHLRKEEGQGLGKLQCTPEARQQGIDAYTHCIQLFALRELLQLCLESKNPDESAEDLIERVGAKCVQTCDDFTQTCVDNFEDVPWVQYPWEDTKNEQRSFALELLLQELPVSESWIFWLFQALQTLEHLEETFAQNVRASKEGDDVSGTATIPGYRDAHVLVDEDPLVQSVEKELEETKKKIQDVLVRLEVLDPPSCGPILLGSKKPEETNCFSAFFSFLPWWKPKTSRDILSQ